MARPFITNVEDIPAFLDQKIERLENLVIRTPFKVFDSSAEGGFYARQLIRLAKGFKVKHNMIPIMASMFLVHHEFIKAMRNRFGKH